MTDGEPEERTDKGTLKSVRKIAYEILDRLEAGKAMETIEAELDISQGDQYFRNAMKYIERDELLKRWPRVAMNQNFIREGFNDEQLRETRAAGIPPALMRQVQKRIAATRAGANKEVKALSEKELKREIDVALARALSYLDDLVLAGASAKELASVIDTLIHNKQLLDGKPTAILSIDDRRTLNELIPRLLVEAKRRGVVINGEAKRLAEPTEGVNP